MAGGPTRLPACFLERDAWKEARAYGAQSMEALRGAAACGHIGLVLKHGFGPVGKARGERGLRGAGGGLAGAGGCVRP